MNKNIMIVARRLVAVLVMLGIALVPIATSNIVSASVVDNKMVMSSVSEKVAASVLKNPSLKEHVTNLSLQYKLDTDNIVIKQAPKLMGSQYIALIPIKDNTGFPASKAVLEFDQQMRVKDTYLYIYNKLANGNYSFTCTTPNTTIAAEVTPNGTLVNAIKDGKNATSSMTTLLNEKGLQNLGTNQNLIQPNSVGGFWTCFKNCAYTIGVPSWVLTSLGIACGIACAISGGAGCLGCLYALWFFNWFDLGACVAQCQGA